MRVLIAAGIGGGGLYILIFLVVVPWVKNLLDVSEPIAVLLSCGIPFVLLLVFVSGMVVQARAHQRQQRL